MTIKSISSGGDGELALGADAAARRKIKIATLALEPEVTAHNSSDHNPDVTSVGALT